MVLSRGCRGIPSQVPGTPFPPPPLPPGLTGLFLTLLPSPPGSVLPCPTQTFPEGQPCPAAGHWSCLEQAVSSTEQPWPLLTEEPPLATDNRYISKNHVWSKFATASTV